MKSKKLFIGKESYYGPIVLKVESWDSLGRPSKVVVGYDDTVFEIQNGDEFITAFISSAAVTKPKGSA